MSRLLIANLVRLKKSKLFWCLVALSVLIALFDVVNLIGYPERPSIDSALFMYPVLIGIMIPIFGSIFFGTEYSDGTIRNKLMIGHLRVNVYLANLVTAISAALVMFVAYMIPVVAIGFPIFGTPAMGSAQFVGMLFTSLVTIVAICSLHVMVSMIYSNKAGATVINLLLSFLLLVVALAVLGELTAPEFIPNYDMAGNLIEYSPNPTYPTGIERDIYQFIVDVLPMGQAAQFYARATNSPLWLLVIYSVVVSAICTAIGIVAFNRKNIK